MGLLLSVLALKAAVALRLSAFQRESELGQHMPAQTQVSALVVGVHYFLISITMKPGCQLVRPLPLLIQVTVCIEQ